jgi:hypothetical protein
MNIKEMHPALSEAYTASVNGHKQGGLRSLNLLDHEGGLVVLKIHSVERVSSSYGKIVKTTIRLNGESISLKAADMIVRAYHDKGDA